MFRAVPVAAEADLPQVSPAAFAAPEPELIPLSHIGLELGVPDEGWPVFLGARGIRFVADRIGRDSVAAGDAARLLAEQREAELKRRARLLVQEAAAIEADELRRSQIWKGVSADLMPPGEHQASVMLAAARDSRPRRQSMVEAALSNDSEMVFHRLPSSEDEL
jgi:hypothetical protein